MHWDNEWSLPLVDSGPTRPVLHWGCHHHQQGWLLWWVDSCKRPTCFENLAWKETQNRVSLVDSASTGPVKHWGCYYGDCHGKWTFLWLKRKFWAPSPESWESHWTVPLGIRISTALKIYIVEQIDSVFTLATSNKQTFWDGVWEETQML